MAKRKVLIIDDNVTICKLLASRLAANDFTVVIASNGPEGIKKAAAERPDVILLDITMPDMDGVEVGMRLRKDSFTKNIPIIMLTARGERTIINLTVERFKPEGYIIKPFNPEKLLEEIDRVLTPKKN
jgi:DNA-binding response OmpR family regulator